MEAAFSARRRWSTAMVALALVLVGLGAIPAIADAADPVGPELLTALRAGGYILYFRHADTDHRQQDQRTGAIDDCTTQRNLTDGGRDHARAIGQAIRALDIPIGIVLASPMCRTVETATLAFGSAQRSSAARDAGPGTPGSSDRFAGLRRLLSTAPEKGTNTVIVAHAYPFYSLVGGQYLDEGQAAIVKPDGAGFKEVARLGLAEWRKLAP